MEISNLLNDIYEYINFIKSKRKYITDVLQSIDENILIVQEQLDVRISCSQLVYIPYFI